MQHKDGNDRLGWDVERLKRGKVEGKLTEKEGTRKHNTERLVADNFNAREQSILTDSQPSRDAKQNQAKK